MTYLSKILVVFGLLICFACDKPIGNQYIDCPTKFIVTSVNVDESLFHMSIYRIEVIDINGFSSNGNGDNLSFTITDSTGKYKPSQVISFK